MPFSSNVLWKTPCWHAHIWSKKRQLCQNYIILWAKQSIGYRFFPTSHENITALMPILSKKCPCSKKTLLSCLYLFKKMSILSKARCSHVIFVNFCMKTPWCHAHNLVKKNQFCHNYCILWATKINKRPLFYVHK